MSMDRGRRLIMDLRLADKTVWLVRTGDATPDLVRACLAENGRVAFFGAANEDTIRDIRSRLGLRLYVRDQPASRPEFAEAIGAAARWGGVPAAVVIQLYGAEDLDDGDGWRATCAAQIDNGGALLILRMVRRRDGDDVPETFLARRLDDDRRRGAELTKPHVRVSALGLVADEPTRDGTVQGSGRLSEPATCSLALFLLGRGAGQAALVSGRGFVQMW